MTELRIQSLKLQNFKGIKSLELPADGADLRIRGDNASGKTTVADAWSWLLWGKDSRGRTDFAIKTLTAAGEPHHGLEHVVEAEVSVGGRLRTLRRCYREKWVKRRGGKDQVMDGHETLCWIDGVPKGVREYQAAVDEICSEEAWRLLTDPTAFSTDDPPRWKWEDRRALVLRVCGDVSDEDVIACGDGLEDLRAVLEEGRSLEDHRAVLQAERRRLNKEREALPPRIDEVRRGMPEEAKGDAEAVRADLEAKRSRRAALAEERAGAAGGGAVAKLRAELQEVEAAMQRRRQEAVAAAREGLGAALERLSDGREAARSAERNLRDLERRLESTRQRRGNLLSDREEELAAWKEEDARQWNPADGVCGACGQNLPADKVEAARKRFNAAKAEKLTAISGKGKRIAAEIADLEADAETLEKEVENARGIVALAQKEEEAEAEAVGVERAKVEAASADDDAEYQALFERQVALEEQIKDAAGAKADAVAALDAKIADLDEEINALEAAAHQAHQRQKAEARLEELFAEEKRLAAELEEVERHLDLLAEFTRAKVTLLEDKVAARFELARFKLFDVQVNGEVVDCCEVLYDGVPYQSGLNHGHQVRVGLDVIRTLQKHFGFAPPVWVDQAESVTELPARGCQVVELVVSAEHQELEWSTARAAA